MRVLITGGYGFIGSHVAEKFYKEGHDIYVIDNLSTGLKENITVKHKFFIADIQSEKCNEIFRSNQFDIVIHLAAQTDVTSSLEKPVHDTSSNIVGLCNMLDLSVKYGVKQFIFASSAAVYGDLKQLPLKEELTCNPMSPYGMTKFIGEYYCEKWNKLYGLDYVCFRFSNVYGPKQGTLGEGGVISKFIRKSLNGEPITIYGDGAQTRDFIYVGDVVDAIYRSVMSQLSGVYNLATNTETSVNQLVDEMNQISDISEIVHISERAGDINHSQLDNSKLKKDLDWIPMISLQDGLVKTKEWFEIEGNNHKPKDTTSQVNNSEYSVFKTKNHSYMPFVENIILFLILMVVDTFLFKWTDVINLAFLYIILISLFFGKTQAVIAAIISIGWYIGESLVNGRDFISLFIDNSIIVQFGAYILIALIIGYVIDRKNNQIQVAKDDLATMEDKYDFLKQIYLDTRVIKEELQEQILHSEDSIGKIYNIIKNLDSLEPDDIFNGAISVLEQILKTDTVSIYLVSENESFMRLISKSNKSDFQIPSFQDINKNDQIKSIIQSHTSFINRELKPDLPILITPIMKDEKTIAIVNIHEVEFEHLTLYYENLFYIATNLISASLTRAYDYVTATHHERFLNNTKILKPQYLKRTLQSKIFGQEKLSIPFSLIEVNESFEDDEKLETLVASLRTTDHIGVDGQGKLWAVLSNTSNQDSEVVLKRMSNRNLFVRLVNEGDTHVL